MTTDPIEIMARAIQHHAQTTSDDSPVDLGDAERLARAALDALTAAGFAVVPREATEEMQRAGFGADDSTPWSHASYDVIWSAMIAAAEAGRTGEEG